MIDNFKEPYNNNNTLDNILQNKDQYKLLSKTAYKKHQDNIENAIKYTPYKYDSELSTNTEKVFYKPNDEIVIAHSGTNFISKILILDSNKLIFSFNCFTEFIKIGINAM